MTTHHASEFDRDAALTTARILLEIQAVNFRPDEPYTLTSGWKSPVYIDCRKIISYPRARTRICDLGVEKINRAIGFETIESIAGGETAGIPFAAWISDRMNLPMAYVRKKPRASAAMRSSRATCRWAAKRCWSRTSPPTAPARSASPRRCARRARNAPTPSWCSTTASSPAPSSR
jgi:orotate phosphoribosyltransferase-like protein